MLVTCQSCGAQYRIDETKIPASGGFIRCKACSASLKLTPPAPAAAASDATMPIPLAGSVSAPAPIPIPVPAPIPAPAGPIALPGSNPVRVGDDDAIPLAESDDILDLAEPTRAAAPSPAPLPDLPSFAGAPLAGSFAPPSFDDLPAPAAPSFDFTSPAAEPEPPRPTSAPTPRFLDDLPTVVPPGPQSTEAASPLDMADLPSPEELGFDDGPIDAASPLPTGMGDLPAPADGALALDDLPPGAPDSLHLTDDLPAPSSMPDSVPSGVPSSASTDIDALDLPAPDSGEVPLALDDLPEPSAPASMSPSGPDAVEDLPSIGTAADLPAAPAPALMDEPAPHTRALAEGPTETSSPSAASGTPEARSPSNAARPTAPGAPRKRRGLLLGGALAGLLLVGGGVTLTLNPELAPFPLPGSEPEPPPAPSKPATAKGKGAEKTPPQAKTKGAESTNGAAKPAQDAPALGAANVHVLAHDLLAAAAAKLAASSAAKEPAQQELLWWAWYRLAAGGDEESKRRLLASVPPQPNPKLGELGAAAVIGAQVLSGKVPMARKNAERLLRTRFKTSAPIAYVLGASFNGKPPARALAFLERALKHAPDMLDARVARAAVLLTSRDPRNVAEGAVELRRAVETSKSPVVALRAATMALAAGQYGALAGLIGPLQSLDDAKLLPAGVHVDLYRILAHKLAIEGDLGGAAKAATQWVEREPQSLEAAQTLARLTAANGGSYAEIVEAAIARLTNPEAKAQLGHERVALALSVGQLDAAKAALDAMPGVPPRFAVPWSKLAEGRIAQHEKRVDAARAAFVVAGRGRPKFAAPRLALLTLAAGPAGPDLAQLTQLARQSNDQEVEYELARTMASRSNHGGAAELLARVVWRAPLVADPLGAVLTWIDALDRAGHADRAQELLKALRRTRPSDPRVGLQMVAMARRHGQASEVVQWFQALSAKEPDNAAYKVALAAALTDDKKPMEAQTLLDTLLRNDPQARSPEILYELGRTWNGRDTIKARSYLTESIRMAPRAASHVLLGELEEGQTKLDEAIEHYTAALELDATLNAPRMRLARIQLQRGQLDAAAEHLRIAVTQNPQDAAAAELLGDVFRDMSKAREALNWYNKASELTPQSTALLLKIAKLQLQGLGAVQPAMKTLRRILQADPAAAEPHYYLGYALKDLGRTKEAKLELETYLRLAPEGELAAEVQTDLRDMAANDE